MQTSRSDTRTLTPDEIKSRIDWAAKKRCHATGDEVIEKYLKGRLEEPGLLGDVLQLLELLPEDDLSLYR